MRISRNRSEVYENPQFSSSYRTCIGNYPSKASLSHMCKFGLLPCLHLKWRLYSHLIGWYQDKIGCLLAISCIGYRENHLNRQVVLFKLNNMNWKFQWHQCMLLYDKRRHLWMKNLWKKLKKGKWFFLNKTLAIGKHETAYSFLILITLINRQRGMDVYNRQHLTQNIIKELAFCKLTPILLFWLYCQPITIEYNRHFVYRKIAP